MKKKVIAAVVIAAVAAGGVWYWQSSSSKASAEKNKTQYVMATVKRGDVRSTISGSGPVASINGVSVKAGQTGTVTQILAQDGDRVKKGQVIMVLENTTLQSQLQQATVDLQNTRTSLQNLLNPQDTSVKAQQLKVENARLTLQQRQQDLMNLAVTAPRQGVVTAVSTTEGSSVTVNALLVTLFDDAEPIFSAGVPQEAAARLQPGTKVTVDLVGLGKLEGVVQPSAGSATPTQGNRDANVPISIALPQTPGLRAGMVGTVSMTVPGVNFVVQASGSIKSSTVEVRSKVAGTVAQATVKEGDRVAPGDLLVQLSSDTLDLQIKQANNDLKIQEQALLNLIDPVSDPNGQAVTLRQKLDQQEITLAARQADVQDLQVKAPADGQTSQLTVRVGDKITANQALFRVADYGAVQVTISVDELDIAKVKVGQPATVQLDALPGKPYRGKVSKINPEGIFKNDIATFEVTVAIDNPQGLMAGMNSTVTVEVENKPGVLWLPAAAVKIGQGKASVQVKNGETLETKEVQVGLRTTQQMEITGGLNEGDQVVQTTVKPASTGLPMGGGGGGGFMGGGGGSSGSTPAQSPTR